jgi:hypothetical protein
MSRPQLLETTTNAPPPQRSRLLDGLLSRTELEAQTGWGWRTVLRREAEGLPVIVIGGTKLYPAERVREWILGHLRQHQIAPRGRGRPCKVPV